MKTAHISGIIADKCEPFSWIGARRGTAARQAATIALLSVWLFGCVQSTTNAPTAPPPQSAAPPAPQAAAPPPLPPILPFDQAVLNAANGVFTTASKMPIETPPSRAVVIDPLVDGVTGYESKATQDIGNRITTLVKRDYPRFAVEKFSPASLKEAPLVLVGTFTAVNATNNQPTGPREAYRFCLVLGDLKTGKVVAKSVARARIADVDATPTTFFRDSPVWTPDASTQAYINTCQATKVGDPISKEFLDGLIGASLVSEAGEAYEGGKYQDALNLYTSAAETPAGDQLRVYNGVYLANYKLGRSDHAVEAYHNLVAYGLRKNRLAVKFLFEPNASRFLPGTPMSGQYGLWLQQIARQAAASPMCLEVAGHTSPTGSSALNERLSFLRADYVMSRLETDAPALRARMIANGVGSRENLVGTGKDDASDALDRRVELKLIAKCTAG